MFKNCKLLGCFKNHPAFTLYTQYPHYFLSTRYRNPNPLRNPFELSTCLRILFLKRALQSLRQAKAPRVLPLRQSDSQQPPSVYIPYIHSDGNTGA